MGRVRIRKSRWDALLAVVVLVALVLLYLVDRV